MHLPIPEMPVRDLVAAMYKSPEQLTNWVQDRNEQLFGPSPKWRSIPVAVLGDQDMPATPSCAASKNTTIRDPQGRTPKLAKYL